MLTTPNTTRWQPKGVYALPTPLGGDKAQVGPVEKPITGPKTVDCKLIDLKAYHRARGLCDHCGEKWSRDHRCAAQVGLHVLDELYALFASEESADSSVDEEDSENTDAGGVPSPTKTLQFHGSIQQLSILILLDLGGSASFITRTLVDQLGTAPVQCQAFSVRVADGNTLVCSAEIPSASWTIDSYSFQHDLKILPIHTYDIILGMDWLQLFSPMKVDWCQKWLAIPYQGSYIRLHDIPNQESDNQDELLVQICSMTVSQEVEATGIPPAIQQLLLEFPEVTTPSTDMPPQRDCDHAIPLIEGAKPINVRPY